MNVLRVLDIVESIFKVVWLTKFLVGVEEDDRDDYNVKECLSGGGFQETLGTGMELRG